MQKGMRTKLIIQFIDSAVFCSVIYYEAEYPQKTAHNSVHNYFGSINLSKKDFVIKGTRKNLRITPFIIILAASI